VNTRFFCTLAASAATLSLIVSAPMARRTHAQGRTSPDFVPPAVFQAAGPNAASLQSAIDQFRAALGGNNNGNAGSQPTGRREINWDGGGSAATSPGPSPFTVFLNSRGAFITTPGSGFVQAPLDGLVSTFGNLTYDSIFQPFSPVRLFSPVGSNITDVQFFVPGSNGTVAATTAGFAAVFSDVDQPDGSGPDGKRGNRGASTLVSYRDANGDLLYSSLVAASPGDAGFSFLGVVFPDARVAHVRITTGDTAPGVDDEDNRDIVMMDDFLYGEPRPLQ
jgi:hypothetical protein